MIKYKLLALFLLTGLFACKQSKFDQLDELLNKTYSADQPGAAVGIVENGKLVYERYFGLANLSDKTPINDSTNFNIGSITKQFTAFAILQLVEAKKISLDDTLKKFFPQLHRAVGNAITTRHLLTHTSGILAHYSFMNMDTGTHANDHDVLKAVEKMDSLFFPPGSAFRYSNTGYDLMSLIIQQVSGLEFRSYLKEQIFERLNMSQSNVINFEEPITHRAIGYTYDTAKKQFTRSDEQESPFFSTQGDGGMYTSLHDYVKWFNGLQQAMEKQAWPEQARQVHALIDSTKKLGYGYGWRVDTLEKPELVYHTGSNGGFRAIVVTIPSENYAVIIFSNRNRVDLVKLVVEINRIFNTGKKSGQRFESLISF